MKKNSFILIIFLITSVFSKNAFCFKTSSQKDPAYRNATFKICADYVTLVDSGVCPAPIVQKSNIPLKRLGAFGTETFATYYSRVVYTPEKKTNIGVNCQVGLYACATIKDTGFKGGDVGCSNTCTLKACTEDAYTNYACRVLSDKTKSLDGRRVCSKESIKSCLAAKPSFKYDNKPYDVALSTPNMTLLDTLKSTQSDESKKIYKHVLDSLSLLQTNLSKNESEFNKGEVQFSEWPEVIEEGNILLEEKIAKTQDKAGSKVADLIQQFMDKNPPVYGPEDDKLHQSYWSDKAMGNTIHDVKALTRGLTDAQAYEIKKLVTDLTTFGIGTNKRLKLLQAAIKLAKAHYGKYAKSYGKAFHESKKVALWRKILKSVPFTFTVDDREKVLYGLIPLSEYQLLQVINYDKFNKIYPDELPKTSNLLERIENVRKLDVRYPLTTPAYMKGIELPEVALYGLIGNPTYRDDVRKAIIEFYKKEVKPDETSIKGQKIYRKYTPSPKVKAFLRAVRFLGSQTADFESRTFSTTADEDSKKLKVLQRLMDYPYKKLAYIENKNFKKALNKKVPYKAISWFSDLETKGDVLRIYASYEQILDLLDKEFKG